MRQVILYGISGASRAYTVLNYFCIYEEFVSISTILGEARRLRMRNPDIEHVYAIDNRYGLRRDYRESMKRNSIDTSSMGSHSLATLQVSLLESSTTSDSTKGGGR